ncbi:MAG: hypothetical protein OEY50_04525 [Nitrospinota bacterium]|nr:hypothetical protein [Nitrospinota bacterium]
MIQLLTYCGVANCLVLAVTLGLGYIGDTAMMAHFLLGFVGSLSAVLWVGVAMFYLIYSGQAVKKAGEAGLMEQGRVDYCYQAKKRLFPWFLTSILLLVMAPFFGATAQAHTGSSLAHHLVAWLAALVFWLSVYLSYSRLVEHSKMIEEILGKVLAMRQAKAGNKSQNDSAPQG